MKTIFKIVCRYIIEYISSNFLQSFRVETPAMPAWGLRADRSCHSHCCTARCKHHHQLATPWQAWLPRCSACGSAAAGGVAWNSPHGGFALR